jgi:hypothetical protein
MDHRHVSQVRADGAELLVPLSLVMTVVALLYVHLTYMATAHDKLVVRHALAPT